MEAFLMIALASLCCALPFVIGQRHGVIALVSPMHLLGYYCAFGFLLKVVVYHVAPEVAFYRRYIQTPWAELTGGLYLGMFILLMCLGYVVAIRAMSRGHAHATARYVAAHITRSGSLAVLALVMATMTFGLILRARGAPAIDTGLLTGLNTAKQINVNADGVGATLAGIKTFFIVPKFAFVLLLARAIVLRRAGALVWAGVLGALLVLIALVSGDRFELVELLIFALSTHVILGGQISWRLSVLGLCALCGVALVSSYMTQLRFGGTDGSLLRQVVGSTYFLDINAATMITDRVAPSQYLLGQSYTWWTFGWIPRAVWPDKPAIDLGVFFKRDVMQIYTGGAFNVTGPGEAFINFGWGGIGIGFVLGWLYRKLEEMLLCARNSLRFGACFAYPILLYPFIQATLQSSFSAFIVGAAAQAVLIAVMIALFVTRFSVWIPLEQRTDFAI